MEWEVWIVGREIGLEKKVKEIDNKKFLQSFPITAKFN